MCEKCILISISPIFAGLRKELIGSRDKFEEEGTQETQFHSFLLEFCLYTRGAAQHCHRGTTRPHSASVHHGRIGLFC